MSGIAGLVRFDGAPVEAGLLHRMTAAMASRGRDGIDHWSKGPAAFGHCMLRTTPESLEETQPLQNADASLVLVLDGRVDNTAALRKDLLACGATLRNRSDAELVLSAYEKWGDECADRVIGEFAFFIWDARQRRLFGARDAAGTRHFYYHAGTGWFAFASEIRGLLALERIEKRLNESRVLDCLIGEFDRDDEVGTFYHDILRLPAGHCISVAEGHTRTWRNWNPANLEANRFASIDECAEAFREQLRVAVKCRLRSIGPVGAMLSGGLDSSSIVGMIRDEFRNELPEPLKTFSLVHADGSKCLDAEHVESMLEGGWVVPVVIDPDDVRALAPQLLEQIGGLNEPFSLIEALPNTCVYRAAKQAGCDVVLDGVAGDLFYYDMERSFKAVSSLRMFSRVPSILRASHRHRNVERPWRTLRRILSAVAGDRLKSAYRSARNSMRPADARSYQYLGEIMHCVRREVAEQFVEAREVGRKSADSTVDYANDPNAHSRLFTSGQLSFAHELYGQTALSMGVEPRSPFSDRRMIEFAIRMPVEAKLYADWYKLVLRKGAAGSLPEKVRWRSDIGTHPGWKFYEALIAHMSQHDKDHWKMDRHASTLSKWLDVEGVERARLKYEVTRDYDTGYGLFSVAVLSTWLSERNLQPAH